MLMYGLKSGHGAMRRVAHLADGEFQPSLCGQPINMTSNVPWGRRVCLNCERIARSSSLVRVRRLS